MLEETFRSWLSNHRSTGVGLRLDIRLSVHEFQTEEPLNDEGDLDLQFDQDRLPGLLERLKYSIGDERANRPALHNVPVDGNIRNGTAVLRSAVSLYRTFRENWTEGTPILLVLPLFHSCFRSIQNQFLFSAQTRDRQLKFPILMPVLVGYRASSQSPTSCFETFDRPLGLHCNGFSFSV